MRLPATGRIPKSGQEAITVADLAERPLVLLDLPLTATYLTTVFEMAAHEPKAHFRTRSCDTVRYAVAAGFGDVAAEAFTVSTEEHRRRIPDV